MKANMQGLPRAVEPKPWVAWLISLAFTIAVICALSFAVYYGMGWIRPTFGEAAPYVIFACLVAAYLALLWVASKQPPLKMEDPEAPVTRLPVPGPTIKSGLHFVLPVVVLVWALMVERLSPGLSAFWAAAFMIFILVTQRPIMALMRRTGNAGSEIGAGGPARRPDRRRAQHDRHRHRHRDGRHHRRRRQPDRRRLGARRRGRGHLGRQHPGNPVPDRDPVADPRHGPADHGELHRRLGTAGAGDRHARPAKWPAGALDRRALVRVLLRHHGGRDATRGTRILRGGGGFGRRPDTHRLHGVLLQPAHGDPALPLHLQTFC